MDNASEDNDDADTARSKRPNERAKKYLCSLRTALRHAAPGSMCRFLCEIPTGRCSAPPEPLQPDSCIAASKAGIHSRHHNAAAGRRPTPHIPGNLELRRIEHPVFRCATTTTFETPWRSKEGAGRSRRGGTETRVALECVHTGLGHR